MKVNPASEEKLQLLRSQTMAGQSGLQSLSKSKGSNRRPDKYAWNKRLKSIVEGRAAILVMSSVTLFALFGVSFSPFLIYMYLG